MAEVLLTQAVNHAEEAIESGNYGGAIETCQRILGQFPEFAGAHRIMGDAYAEQGELEAARQAYQRTLERDPQSIPAHLGLGMLAEDAGDGETALAYFQVAWEIDPRRRDLREHVSRVSQQLYGADGRLYLTRAALASLHFHAGRWDRSVSEAAQVLQEFPTRIDVQVRLAEALWRRSDDGQAKQICTTILRSLPQAVVPLLILADIHRREGDRATAEEFLTQARDIDPDGVRAADLIMVGFDDQADFLAVDDIPMMDDQVVQEEPARYTPAPDFTSSDSDDVAGLVDDALLVDAPAPGSDLGMPDFPDLAPDPGIQPFRWEDVGDEDLETSDLEPMAETDPASAVEFDAAEEFSLPADEELNQARPGDERPHGYTGVLDSLESEGMEPFDPSVTQSEQESGAWTEDRSTDDFWTDISLPTDEELDRARPSTDDLAGHTELLESFDAAGVEPFDPFGDELPSQPEPETLGVDDSADEFSFPSDEEIEEVDSSEAANDEADLDQMAAGWEEEIDETADSPPLEAGESLESIDVVFDEDETTQFSETVWLGSGQADADDDVFGSFDESAGMTQLDATIDDPWQFDSGLEELIAEADAANGEFFVSASDGESHELTSTDAPEEAAAEDSPTDVSRESDLLGQPGEVRISAERLGLDEALIQRAREAKAHLVAAGRISGSASLGGEAAPLDGLRDAVESAPRSIDDRMALAAALVADHPDEALEEFRWVYRNAPERGFEMVEDLGRLIDVMREREVGVHRLLGAVYRRNGDWAAASRHYEESLLGKWRRISG